MATFTTPASEGIYKTLPTVSILHGIEPRDGQPPPSDTSRWIYLSFSWRNGLKGTFPSIAKVLQDAGYYLYPWWSNCHACADKHVQAQWIFNFVRQARAFVWDLSDNNEARTDSSSKAIWQFALGAQTRVVLLDKLRDSRPFNTAAGGKQHPILNYLFGSIVNKHVSRVFSPLVGTDIEAADIVSAAVEAEPAVPALPLTCALKGVDSIPPGRPRVYLSFPWRTESPLVAECEARGIALYPWWETTGATHVYQMRFIERFMAHDDFAGFIWDVTDVTRPDGSSKGLFHFALGAGKRCVIIDAKLDERDVTYDTERPKHAVLRYMGGQVAGADLGPQLRVPMVKTLAQALDVLSL